MVLSRLQLALATALACAFAALVGAVLASRGGEDGAAQPAPGFRGSLRPQGIPPRDIRLRDQDGRPASLAALRGNVVVVTFLYTTCEDTCPLIADQIRGALDDLGHDVPTLAISVDPVGDTPARARRFLLEHRLTGRNVRFLLGDRTALTPVWKAYGIRPQGDDFDHSASVVLIDRSGHQRIGFPADQLTPEALAHDIARLESEV